MGWDRGRARTLARVAVVGTVLAVGLLAVPGVPGTPGAPPAVPVAYGAPAGDRPLARPDSPGGCGGGIIAANITGVLGVEGGPYPPPPVANRTIEVAFEYLENLSVRGGPPTFQCLVHNVTATTGGNGAFAADMTVPGGSGCSGGNCVYFTGPYAPVTLGVAGTPPAGYFVTSSLSGTTATVDLVAALDSVALAPFGRTTVSDLAPVTLTAEGLAGNGAASPATLTFAWTMSGAGWTVTGGAGTDALTVGSTLSAGLATVTVYVNGSYGGAALAAPSQQALLTPITTTASGGDVTPTALDVGTPARITLAGTGAAGYSYTGEIFPGLSAPEVRAPCAGVPMNGGLLALNCSATVTYASTGVATPSATLTNGYSASGAVSYPAVAVAASLGFVISPQPDLAYNGTPTTIVVAADPGAGTLPYGTACYWPGNGALQCKTGGPTWTFHVTFGLAGQYTGHVTVADAGGANVSVLTSTLVTLPPHLAPFPERNGTVPNHQPFLLTSALTGGALPANFWWNDSVVGASGQSTIALGPLWKDGPLDCSWVPTEPGLHDVTLTVVDGLGTVQTAWFRTLVVAGPVAAIAPARAAPWTTAAGVPYNVSWVAVDDTGNRTTQDLAPVTLSVAHGGAGTTITRLSDAAGPVPAGPDGSYLLPASAWSNGYLNFSLTATHAGKVALAFGSNAPIQLAQNGTAVLTVTPDLGHVALSHPLWGRPGAANGANDTLWTIADEFDNPVDTGSVTVQTDFAGVVSDLTSWVLPGNGSASVWVNFTVPFGVGGTVRVFSAWSPVQLWAATIPGAGAPTWIDYALPLGLLALAVVSLGVAIRGRRPPSAAATTGPPATPPADDPLLRLAQGRAHVLSRADPDEPRDLAELARGWTGRPPDPAELTEWVSSLVAEGALRASVGPDGKPQFVRAPPGTPPPTEAPPRIEIDAAALEAALARRPEPDGPPADDGRPDGPPP